VVEPQSHQAASACDDYVRVNDFLTGGGNDHAEADGWSDRNYYALAWPVSTGILNRTPYAYARPLWHAPARWRNAAKPSSMRAGCRKPALPSHRELGYTGHRGLMLYPLSLVPARRGSAPG
jgi:hypothetical protein